MRTSAGRDFQSRVMGDSASTGTGLYASARFMAVTENATAPADGDTALTGELTAGGFIRAAAAFAHTTGATTFTHSLTFTSSDAAARTIQKVAMFNAATVGTMVFSTAVPSPPTLISGDALTVTSTVSL